MFVWSPSAGAKRPGLIGLFRAADRLVLCSDRVYTLNVETSVPADPAVVWPGHTHPVRGDVRGQLERAAAT